MNRILSSPQITPSPQTNESSFTMSTRFRNSALNVREWDEEEEQGPRVSYRGKQRWGTTHRKQMRRGRDTQAVHAVEIRSETWCASCASGGGGNKGEERGSSRRGRRAGDHVPQKKKERRGKGEMGGPVRETRHES